MRDRSIRTLDIFLTELAAKSHGELPKHFCITLPKVTLPDEVAALADICSRLEPMLDFEPGALRIELMVETSQAIFNERGEANLLPLVSAARGRCVAAHFGPLRLHLFAGHRRASPAGRRIRPPISRAR